MRIVVINLLLLALVASPVFLIAAEGDSPFIVCNPAVGDDCDFDALARLGKNIIDFLIVLSTALAAVVFAFAGFTLLASGGNESKRDKAKEMVRKPLFGFLVVLAAWLVINTILNALLRPDFPVKIIE